jgi:type VI secretion system protein ImpL
MITYLIAAGVYLVYCVLTWLLARWARPSGADFWILLVALWVIGLVIAAGVVYLVQRRRQNLAGPSTPLADEAGLLVREANRRLGASTAYRRGGSSIAGLPVVLLLGETGATKTTAVRNSGLDPELLAGLDSQENNQPAPTNAANFWLMAGTVFAEAGGPLLGDISALRRLATELRSSTLAGLFGRKPARAAIVCLDAERLLGPDPAALVDAGRRMNAALDQIARAWGSRLPVYVLVTRLDRVNYFMDYVRSMSREEANQVFGASFPATDAIEHGAYNQQQTARLARAFDHLANALTEKRIDYLRREEDPARSPNVCVFPRDLR